MVRVPVRSSSVVVFAASLLVVALASGARAAAPPSWSVPVPGPVVRPFVAPAGPYAAGHRGIDFAVAPGDPVRAAGDGVVTFAGAVATTLHVVVAHGDGVRTTYSFLTDLAVHAGDRVRGGEVIARAAGTGPEHAGVLHFGVRTGDVYVDPILLFGPVDLATAVHLAPVAGDDDPLRHAEHDRTLLARALGVASDVPGWLATGADAVGDAVAGGAHAAADAIGAAAAAVGRPLVSVFGPVEVEVASIVVPAIHVAWTVGASSLPFIGKFVMPIVIGRQVVDGIGDWIARQRNCSDLAADDAPMTTGHLLLTIGGLGSWTEHASVDALPTRALGYRDEDVVRFSYAPAGGWYGPADTYGSVLDDAHRLAAQLRAIARSHPGQEVDLVGHSLGGVVLRAFLTLVYDPGDPSYPPLGPAIAFAAPFKGAALASLGHDAAASGSLQSLVEVVGAVVPLPPVDAPIVRDLAEGSEFVHRLEAAPLPEGQRFLSIGALNDVVVPAERTRIAGDDQYTVEGDGSTHNGVVRAPESIRVARRELNGDPLPCTTIVRAVRARLTPYAIEQAEQLGRNALDVVGRGADAFNRSVVGE